MKKIFKFMLYIFLVLVLTFLIFLLMFYKEANGAGDMTARGEPAATRYPGGSFPGAEIWLNHIKTSDILCSEPNTAQTYGRGPDKVPTVKIHLDIDATESGKMVQNDVEYIHWEDTSVTEEYWNYNKDDVTSLSIKDLTATRTNHPCGKSGNPIPGEGEDSDSGSSAEVTVYTNGKTKYESGGGGGSYVNNAMAYILAEEAKDGGLMPANSYINVCYWMLMDNPSAHDASVSTEFFSTSTGGVHKESLEDVLADLQDELNDPDLSDTARQALLQQIDQLQDLLNTTTETDDMYLVDGATAGLSSSLYEEALIFGQMWNEIYNKYSGDYINSVVDKTDKEKVNVQFNSTGDDKGRFYIVGPFNVQYLEYYTPVSGGKGAQLCGMTGIPELTAKIWGEDTPLTLGEDYEFVYGVFTGIPAEGAEEVVEPGFIEDRATFPNIPTQYDAYPHSGEDFYLKVWYQEGMNAISKMKFYFRYLTARASTSGYEGNILTQEWKATVEIEDCNAGSKCNYGSEHTSPHSHWTGNYTPYEYDTDNPDTEEDESQNIIGGHDKIYENCTGGKKCTHGFYHYHYVSVSVTVDTKYNGDKQHFQNIVVVHESVREYTGGGYGEAVTGEGNPEKEITWDIDLTTTLMGWVWKDVTPDEKKGSSNLIGKWERSEASNSSLNANEVDVGVKNVPVKVYLYDQDGNNVGEALMHQRGSGARYTGQLITDENGRWGNPDEVTFEAPGTEKELFYVVEFEYDGQIFNNVPFLGNGVGEDNIMNEQTSSQAYTLAMNNKDEERSKAVTEAEKRREFDKSFGIITGDSPMSGDNTTTGKTYTTSLSGEGSAGGESKELQYKVMPSTKINSKEYYNGSESSSYEHIPVVSRLDEPWEEDSDSIDDHQHKFEDAGHYDRFRLKATTWYNGGGDGLMDPEQYRTKYPQFKVYYMDGIKYGDSGEKHLIAEYMRHLNLGLFKRKETDLNLLKDLYKVTVVVNEQKQVYKFNPYGLPGNGLLADGKYVELEQALELVRNNDGQKGYSLGLYESDVAYSSMKRYQNAIDEVRERKDESDLRVFATYVIRLYNTSDTEDAEFREIRDFYDPAYTVVQDDNYELEDGFLKASIVNDEMKRETTRIAEAPYYRLCRQDTLNTWGATKEENLEGFSEFGEIKWEDYGDGKSNKTTSLEGLKITKDEYLEIFTTYEIDKEGYDAVNALAADANVDEKDIQKMREALIMYSDSNEGRETEHKNTAEISSYSTYYGAENHQYINYRVGDIAGRVDKDSAPNNIRYGEREATYEDDTYEALMLKLKIKTAERQIEGYVFEDKKTKEINDAHPVDSEGVVDNSETLKIKVGDGNFDTSQSDKGISNVEVSMYEVINLGELDINESGTFAGLEYYYKVPDVFYGGKQKTDSSGHFKLDGFLAGDYVIRYDYGKEADTQSATHKVYSANHPEGEDKSYIKYNGQDYENTKFLGDYIGEGDDSKLNMKFLPIDGKDDDNLKEKTVSKARDNESRRLEVIGYSRTIENERAEILRDRILDGSDESKEFVEKTKMYAETPIMKIEVEDPAFLNKDAENQGDDGKGKKEPENDDTTIEVYEYGGKTDEFANKELLNKKVEIPNINFGLEERARTDIELKTFINQMQIYKADELVFTVDVNDDGTINYESETARSRKLTSLPTDYGTGKNQQGFYAIEIENDYLNGLNLIIQYKLQVINNSEIDFTSRLAGFYRQDVIDACAKNVPTSTFYEDVMSDYKKMLLNADGEYEVLKEGEVRIDNVFRLNSNAIRKIFNLSNLEYDGDSNTQQAMDQMKNTPDEQEDDTLRPEVIVYGLYTGRYYYENKVLNREDQKNIYTIKDYLRKKGDSSEIKIEYERDRVVKTTVNKLAEYVDIDASLELPPQGYVINYAWETKAEADKQGEEDQVTRDAEKKVQYKDNTPYKAFESLMSDASYRTENGDAGLDLDFYDLKDRKYIRTGQSNIGFSEDDSITIMQDESGNDTNRQQYSDQYIINNRNPGLSRQLEPAYYVIPRYMDEKYGGAGQDKEVYFKDLEENADGTVNEEGKKKKDRVVGEMYVKVSKVTSSAQDADEINIDNIAEILVYSNSTGRRDVYSVPGNALAIGAYASKFNDEKNVWYSGYNSIRMGANAYNRDAFAARNLLLHSADASSGLTPESARSTPNGEWPNGFMNEKTQQWTLYPEDDQWATEYVSVIPPTGIAFRNFVKTNLPQLIVGSLAVMGLAVLFINKQIKIRRNKNKF